jgi:hypothetical protein
VRGYEGQLGGESFYEVKLDKNGAAAELERLLAPTVGARRGVSLTTDLHDANRLRLTEVQAPDFEAAAAARYLRGNALRVSGRPGNSCNLDLSARFGVPPLLDQLTDARAAAVRFVLLRVPSRARDLLEIIPDIELEETALGRAGDALAGDVWTHDDFADWESGQS